jgi:predicted Ser/Thr protein kinase
VLLEDGTPTGRELSFRYFLDRHSGFYYDLSPIVIGETEITLNQLVYCEKYCVFEGAINGEAAFVKVSRGNYQRNLERECDAYKELAHLQGKFIPKLLYHGQYFNEYIVVTSHCGSKFERRQVTPEIMYTLEYTLKEIHKTRSHGSPFIRNIVVNQYGHPFIIDLERSRRNPSEATKKEEMRDLFRLL